MTHPAPPSAHPAGDPRPHRRHRVGAVERGLRQDLALAHRLVAREGWEEPFFTHLSLRLPGSDHFLVSPRGLLFEEATASSLVRVDAAGRTLDDAPWSADATAFALHAAVHEGRSDAHCVMHVRSAAGQAVAAQRAGLRPLSASVLWRDGGVGLHDLAAGGSERLLADLGDRNALVLRHRGTLAVGQTVAEAWLRLYWLERACAVQVAALSGGADVVELPAHATAPAGPAGRTQVAELALQLVWPALRRRLDRSDPSYRD